jgi:hypothetical protein
MEKKEHDNSRYSSGPEESAVNDIDYYGAVEDTYGKVFFRTVSAQLRYGDVFLFIGKSKRIENLGAYTGLYEITGVHHEWTREMFSTSFTARRLTNYAAKSATSKTKTEQKYVSGKPGDGSLNNQVVRE